MGGEAAALRNEIVSLVQVVRADRQDGPKSSGRAELHSRDGVVAPVIRLAANDPRARYPSPMRCHQLAQGGEQLKTPSSAATMLSDSTCFLDVLCLRVTV